MTLATGHRHEIRMHEDCPDCRGLGEMYQANGYWRKTLLRCRKCEAGTYYHSLQALAVRDPKTGELVHVEVMCNWCDARSPYPPESVGEHWHRGGRAGLELDESEFSICRNAVPALCRHLAEEEPTPKMFPFANIPGLMPTRLPWEDA